MLITFIALDQYSNNIDGNQANAHYNLYKDRIIHRIHVHRMCVSFFIFMI